MQESQAEGPARAKGQRTAATVCKASCEPAPLRTEEEDPRRAPRSEDQRKQHWVTPRPDRGDQEKRGLVTQAWAPQARPQPSCLSVNKFVQRSLRPRGPEPRRPRAQTAFVQAVKGLFIPALASRPLNPACPPAPGAAATGDRWGGQQPGLDLSHRATPSWPVGCRTRCPPSSGQGAAGPRMRLPEGQEEGQLARTQRRQGRVGLSALVRRHGGR